MKRIKYTEVRKVQPDFFEYNGIHKTDPVEMQLFVYNNESFEEYKQVNLTRVLREINDEKQKDDVKWFNIHGLHDVALIKEIGTMLDIEPFIVSDILNVNQRSKIEELDDVLFFSIKSVLPSGNNSSVKAKQISFILKDNILVSFQEKKSEFFTHIRERIKTHSGIVRKKKNDYLLYLLLEAVMANFYITIETHENEIEKLTIEARTNDNPDILVRIEKSRENINLLKRAILPLRDALSNLKSRQDKQTIDKANYGYFARLSQRTMEILEQLEYDMNTLESASNFYLSAKSHRMNEIMKILTVVSVIFMPLTFIVGVYGMNFDVMPELRWEYGYFIILATMFILVLGMIYYFKKKKWF